MSYPRFTRRQTVAYRMIVLVVKVMYKNRCQGVQKFYITNYTLEDVRRHANTRVTIEAYQ